MKILFLEDSAPTRRQTLELLLQDGYKNVTDCFAIDEANEFLEEHTEGVDCIITDLNMDDEWLEEYRDESQACVLSGWVWLRHFVWGEEGYEAYKNVPCIIYSGFIRYLEDYLKEDKNTDSQKDMREHHVILVEKGKGYDYLKEALKQIEKEMNA